MAGQPSNIEPYLQSSNPVTRDPLEQKATEHREQQSTSGKVAPSSGARQEDAVPSASGRGVSGSGPVDAAGAEATGRGGVAAASQSLENENVNAEQMATLGEGAVADAVARKSGTQQVPGQGPAEEQDFASDLDRKKAEQAEAREEIKTARKEGGDVDRRALGNETMTEV